MTFIDTNVLVHAAAESSPLRDRARDALARAAEREPLTISRQILREYVAVMTRPQVWGRPLRLSQAVSDAGAFIGLFTILEDGPLVWNELVALARRYSFAGRQVHDANIVATMVAHRERGILTLNEADFRRFDDLIEVLAVA